MNYLIGRTGEKIQTEFTTKSPSEFINEIKKLKGNVVIVIKDPLRELTEDLRRQVDVIGRLTKETETDQNSSYMDDSMTYEDLVSCYSRVVTKDRIITATLSDGAPNAFPRV